MAEKFQNKYRNNSFRAQWWDYGAEAAYFITICTKEREHYFGEIENGKMNLSHLGVIAYILWYEIPKHHQHIQLGEFVVMPNHVHGIIIIDKSISENNGQLGEPTGEPTNQPTNEMLHETLDDSSNQQNTQPSSTPINQQLPGTQHFQNIGKNTLSSVLGSYKSAVTKYANRLGIENGWQRLFHDHIIRDDAEYHRIANYIQSNPQNWNADKFYLNNE